MKTKWIGVNGNEDFKEGNGNRCIFLVKHERTNEKLLFTGRVFKYKHTYEVEIEGNKPSWLYGPNNFLEVLAYCIDIENCFQLPPKELYEDQKD